jgi:hypothetical protein
LVESKSVNGRVKFKVKVNNIKCRWGHKYDGNLAAGATASSAN